MKFAEYVQHDATALAALVRAREVSADELLEVAIARSAQVNPHLNAVVLPHHAEARQAIRDGLPQGAFTGVPFLIKDLFIELKGTVTTNGCAFLRDHASPADSTIAARYRQAGLVMFGKTHSPELGSGPTTESRLYGVTRNPWDLSVTPGGSSGGSAAAIAAGIVPAANASDAGGSIRIPASLTGLFGLKPTRGRVPLGPARFDGGGGIATLHAITRSVRDSAALLDAVSGPESGATYGGPARADCQGAVARAPGRLRIALNLQSPAGGETAAECLAAAHAAARMCEALGHEVALADPEIDMEVFARARHILLASTMAGAVLGLQRTFDRQAVPDDFEPLTWKLLEQGQAIRGHEVLWAREAMFTLHKQMAAFMASHDVVLSPSLQALGPRPGTISSSQTSEEAFEGVMRYVAFTMLYNLTGQPSMSVPLHWTDSGLPVGVQFTGRFGAEETLFSLAAQLEAAHPWFDRLPVEPYAARP